MLFVIFLFTEEEAMNLPGREAVVTTSAHPRCMQPKSHIICRGNTGASSLGKHDTAHSLGPD